MKHINDYKKRVCGMVMIFIIASIPALLQAQPNINRVEWYLDNDPGYGNATTLAITPAPNIDDLAININLLPITQGVHMVGVRSRDDNGAWSFDNKWIFIKPFGNSGATPQPNINRVEWYLDSDPGYGNAIAINITPAESLADLAISIDIAALQQGAHVVGVRSRDANGAWSFDNRWIFLKPYGNNGAIPQPVVNRVEWYLNSDPGYGNATPVNITPAQNLMDLFINIDIATLPQGVHVAGIRSRDANGAWSHDNKWIFIKPYAGPTSTPIPRVIRMEYYIDTDPGYGLATPITFTAATNVANVIFDADISTVPNGNHQLGIRSLDEYGAWSHDNPIDFTGGTFNSGAHQWVGNISTAWNNPANWSTNTIPGASNAVVIPANRPFNPTIGNGVTANCKSITVQPGASITIATGGNLKVDQ